MTQEITAYTAALRSISSAAKRKAKKHNLPVAISEKAERNEIYLSLQINLNDPTSILNDFVRYDIEIVKVFSKQSVQNVHEEAQQIWIILA